MREKILDLMKSEGLKSSQLAEMLEINPAGISHILAGRNKPGFDLLQKILRRFPQISPDWLLLDNGPMYRANQATSGDPLPANGNGVGRDFGGPATHRGDELFQSDIFSSIAASKTSPEISGGSATQTMQTTIGTQTDGARIGTNDGQQNSSTIARIVIFYNDQTFETYAPTKR